MPPVEPALWQRIVQQVVAAGGNVIRPWFTELEPVSLDGGLLEIRVADTRQRDYCRRHATRLFTEAAQAATGRLVGVCFLTAAESPTEPALTSPTVVEVPSPAAEGLPLGEDYTFDAFVTGPCNRLAHAACMAVTESPGKTYNPLYIHGSVGLGKTHLLQATCHKIAANDPDTKLVVLSCEMLVNHFIEAVERGQLHEFRYRYRHADILAIDDIQFLSAHEQTQEEFFHTFNTLYQSQRQIILSSDRGPGQIPDLEERLVSRFNWGLVAQIDKPCYETRVAIVRKKARLRNIELPEEVVCLIAGVIDSNTRELEGAIAKISMLAQVTGRHIDISLAEEALGTTHEAPHSSITIEDILKAVTTRFNVRIADLQSKKRTRSIALPRQVCMYLARELTRHSLEEIGGYFGGRDHTTVMHAKRSIDLLRTRDAQLQATLDLIRQELSSQT